MKRQIQFVNVYKIDLYHCGQGEGMSGIFRCICVCMRAHKGLNVWLVGLKVCLCMSPSLMHGQCVYLVLFLS